MSKWKKWLQQSIAVVSVLALMAGMPPQMRAQEAEDTAGTAQEQTGGGAGATDENGEAFILGEDTTKRDENVKHFRMSDGSYTMVQYGTPVHYEKDGAWEDIDSTLSEGQESTAELAEIEGITTYAAQQPEEVYGIAGNSFDVKFAKKSNGKFLMKLKQEDASIYWSVVSPQKNKVTGQATNGAAQSDDPMSLTRLTSQMLYADIFEDTDLQYIVTPTGVKENIIVKKAQSAYAYTFELKVKGVTLSLEEDGSIAVRNGDGSDRFVIPAPYMFDAAGDISEAVRYELEAGKNGKTYTLSVVADEDWINASGRQFPVTIDPAVQLKRGWDSVHDATLAYQSVTSAEEDYLNTAKKFGTSKLWVGMYRSGLETGALIQTPIKELKNVRVINALMHLKYYTTNPENIQVNAYKVDTAWDMDRNLIKLGQHPSINSKKIDYTITDSNSTNEADVFYDITSVVQDWIESDSNNHGILLRAENYTQGLVKYLSSDHQGGALGPQFIINYRDAKGVEPQWTYTSMSGGQAATAYVNNYNGELTVMSPKRPYKLNVGVIDGLEPIITDGGNYPCFPIVPLYSPRGQSSIVGFRRQIDCHDLIESGYANDIDDASLIYWTISNAGGMDDIDLAKFIRHMRTVRAAVVDDDGAKAEAHTVDMPYQSREAILDRLESDMYRDFMVLNTNIISSGNSTATAIKAAYEPMNLYSNMLEANVRRFIRELMKVIGISDEFKFLRSSIVNDLEKARTIQTRITTVLMLRELFGDERVKEMAENILAQES